MIYAYVTGKAPQDRVVRAYAQSVNADVKPITDFIRYGLPDNTDTVVFSGILNGNAKLMQECINQSVDYYYIDHAYFNSGYSAPTWMRITRNGFVQNNIVSVNSNRWSRFFNQPLQPYNYKKKKPILILPPSDAVTRTFNEHQWLKETIIELRKYTDRPIMVRQKNGPVMNAEMTKTVRRKSFHYTETAAEQIENSYCVVAYNSNLAVDALIKGVPVICTKNCAAWPLSNRFENIENLKEYKRLSLFISLSWGQYNLSEIENGIAQRNLSRLNQVFEK